MLVRIAGIYLHEILLVSAVKTHFARLAVGVLLDGIEKLLAARYLEDAVNLLHRLVAAFAQCARALLAIYGCKLTINLLVVVDYPLPHCSLLGMKLGAYVARCKAVASAQDIVTYGTLQC